MTALKNKVRHANLLTLKLIYRRHDIHLKILKSVYIKALSILTLGSKTHSIVALGLMKISKMTFTITTLGILTIGIITKGIITIGIAAFSKETFGIMALGIITIIKMIYIVTKVIKMTLYIIALIKMIFIVTTLGIMPLNKMACTIKHIAK